VFKLGDVGFGDRVRIEEVDATILSGHSGRVGDCFGMTTPSVTGVEVIGDAVDDVALNVHFEAEDITDAWFAPEVVTLVEHPEGSRAVQATVGTNAVATIVRHRKNRLTV
jgi:hypothetical protein